MSPFMDLLRAIFARRPRTGETWETSLPHSGRVCVVVRSVAWNRVAYEWDWVAKLPPGSVAPPLNERSLFDFKLLYRKAP